MPGMKTLTGMTGTGSAIELAEMLRQMGRGRDTVLAHITPEEAQMLMDQGGSGDTNPNTGLPEFLDIYGGDAQGSNAQDFVDYGESYGNVTNQPVDYSYMGNENYGFGYGPEPAPAPTDMAGFRQPSFIGGPEMPPGTRFDIGVPSAIQRVDITSPVYREPFSPFERAALPPTPEEPGLAQRAEAGLQQVRDLASKYPRLTAALGTGAQGIAGLVNAARMRRQGREAAERFRQLGAPMRQEAENLRQQALAGQLTPQQASAQEAARARMRQAAAGRGTTTGTQGAMIENQLARQRAELSQTNLNNALRQLNLANAYDEAAIKASLAADREADDLLGEIFQNIAFGRSAVQGPRQQTAGVSLPTQPETTRRPEIPRG